MSDRHRIPPTLAGAKDLREIVQQQGPGKLTFEVVIRYGANFFEDVNDVVPFIGIAARDGSPIRAMLLTSEDGVGRLFVMEQPMIDTITQFVDQLRAGDQTVEPGDVEIPEVEGLLGDDVVRDES